MARSGPALRVSLPGNGVEARRVARLRNMGLQARNEVTALADDVSWFVKAEHRSVDETKHQIKLKFMICSYMKCDI